MLVYLDPKSFEKTMFNVINYSLGFIEGVNKGKRLFIKNLGDGVIESLSRYIDSTARMNPQALQHMYEWYKTGSPDARLYSLKTITRDGGLSINSTFKQSTVTQQGNKEPFYNKARIMEQGIPITINPKPGKVLAFTDGGKDVFTRKEIHIQYPGGRNAKGSYEKTFDEFFKTYFSQAFLKSSGILDYIENPKAYKNKFAEGAKGGKSIGIAAGFNWIVEAKVGVE
jgi:hypothetical protein